MKLIKSVHNRGVCPFIHLQFSAPKQVDVIGVAGSVQKFVC